MTKTNEERRTYKERRILSAPRGQHTRRGPQRRTSEESRVQRMEARRVRNVKARKIREADALDKVQGSLR